MTSQPCTYQQLCSVAVAYLCYDASIWEYEAIPACSRITPGAMLCWQQRVSGTMEISQSQVYGVHLMACLQVGGWVGGWVGVQSIMCYGRMYWCQSIESRINERVFSLDTNAAKNKIKFLALRLRI